MFIAEKRPQAQFVTAPAPVGGINAYNSLADMQPIDAISLINLIPQPYGCKVRGGSRIHNTGLGGSVNSLAHWPSMGGSTKIFAWAAGKMYDVTSSGAVGAAIVSGLTSSWWQSVNFANSGGTHLVSFSGTDDPIWYSTPGIARLTAGDGIVTGTIKGVNPQKLIQATVHMRRIWAVEVNTMKGWYWPTDAIYGDLKSFDFGPIFKRGGYLVALSCWTVDSGDGADDKLVAISSMGEAAVYSGIDVANANTWRLEGVYFVGHPVRGRRIMANVAGDLYLLTSTGVVSMATMVTSTQVNLAANNTYSKKIAYLLSAATSDLGDLDGWELKFVPDKNLFMVNVPSVYAEGAGQIVANHITTSWTLFRDLIANTWLVVEDDLLFGTAAGNVIIGLVGNKDNVAIDGTGGSDIRAFCQQAFSYMGAPAVQKQIGMYRPNFILTAKIGFASEITYNFKTGDPGEPTGSNAPIDASLWGTAKWNEGKWGASQFTQLEWRQAEGIGVAASLSIGFASHAETIWVSTDFTYIKGGPL